MIIEIRILADSQFALILLVIETGHHLRLRVPKFLRTKILMPHEQIRG